MKLEDNEIRSSAFVAPTKFRPQHQLFDSLDIGKNPLVMGLVIHCFYSFFEVPLPKTSYIGVKNNDLSKYEIQQINGELITQQEMEYFLPFQWENIDFVESVRWADKLEKNGDDGVEGLISRQMWNMHVKVWSPVFNEAMTTLMFRLQPKDSNNAISNEWITIFERSAATGDSTDASLPFKKVANTFSKMISGGMNAYSKTTPSSSKFQGSQYNNKQFRKDFSATVLKNAFNEYDYEYIEQADKHMEKFPVVGHCDSVSRGVPSHNFAKLVVNALRPQYLGVSLWQSTLRRHGPIKIRNAINISI